MNGSLLPTTLNHRLSELFRLHHRELVRFAARLVGDRETGEEIAQDAYLRIVGRNALAGPIEHLKAYLFISARHVAIDVTARRRTEWSYRVDIEDLDAVLPSEDHERALEHRQRIAALAVALNELAPACRAAFVMNKLEGRSHKEIAARLGVSTSMVEKHMMRAMLHCRDVLRNLDEY
ncbi:sigma-70 family RNA polymerase sigma factor [Ancylobacter sp. 6x-1]|uniref:Sigma-70 family RNA polymerase sigma factor n=1 Tax=Ancylobacter crimeensis TaxID=2579147 RepID=A0ABT0DAI2_9HYPH|nr:sigma-70 family RNA polymerase sigma factor [Ancylobacter crimeensis]MCK0196965.1 sigma-70 family RNA polymerase sigma factor [Ancylobacter crimeensis]